MGSTYIQQFGSTGTTSALPALSAGDVLVVVSYWGGQFLPPLSFSEGPTTDTLGNTYTLIWKSYGTWTASWVWVCKVTQPGTGTLTLGSNAVPGSGGVALAMNFGLQFRGDTANGLYAAGGGTQVAGSGNASLTTPNGESILVAGFYSRDSGQSVISQAVRTNPPNALDSTWIHVCQSATGGIGNSQWGNGYAELASARESLSVPGTSPSTIDWQFNLVAVGIGPVPQKTIISLSTQPGFFDISDAVLGCEQPLADYDLIKISYNAKLAVCRPEAFFMGYYTDGNTLPLPVSPLDAYAYNLTESLYFFQLDSTKPPLPGFSPGQETSPALDFTGQPVEGFLCDPYQLTPNFGTLTQGGFSTEKQITLKSLFYEHGSVGDNVPQQPYPAGSIAAYCFGQRQSATMAPILPGSSYQTNFQPVFYDFPDAAIFDGAPVTQQMMQAISRNAKLGIFRFEIFFMGYYRNNDIVPTPVGAGNYSYAYNECIFMPMLGSSRQPTGDFVTGQVYFPPLANLDVYQFPANALPEQLFIDPATGQVSCSINGANGPQGQGSVAVYCFAQRYPNLTMAAQPFFVDIPDTDFVGGQVPSASLLQQLNDNAKFGIVATEAFFMGYFENGDIISAPTSPVDNYTYDNFETLYIPVWVSSHKAAGLTPGQKTWPAFSADEWTPTSNTTLVASPYKCFVNQYTVPYGQITAQLYGAGNGITNQGIVAVYAIGSRRRNITGTTL